MKKSVQKKIDRYMAIVDDVLGFYRKETLDPLKQLQEHREQNGRMSFFSIREFDRGPLPIAALGIRLERLKEGNLVESGHFNFQYRITDRGIRFLQRMESALPVFRQSELDMVTRKARRK